MCFNTFVYIIKAIEVDSMNYKALIFCALSMLILGSCASNKQPVEESSLLEQSSKEPRTPPEYLRSLPVPSNMTQKIENRGVVETFSYQTKVYDINGNASQSIEKKAHVYLPYDYDERYQYDVLYLMHGGGETYTYWFQGQKGAAELLDNIFDQGLAKSCIVVAPTFYTGDSSGGGMNSEATDIFKYEFRNDLVPAIEEEYATYCKGDVSEENLIATREHRGFAGLSMGSMTSIRAALLGNLDICAYISSMSGGYDASDEDGTQGFALIHEALTVTFKDYPIAFWLNSNGTNDIALTPHQNLNNLILSEMDDYFTEGQNYDWILFPGGQHDFTSWLADLYNTMLVFFL